jgi:hypothetical protein
MAHVTVTELVIVKESDALRSRCLTLYTPPTGKSEAETAD